MSHHNTELKKTASDKVAEFISNNRTVLWISLAVLIVAIVVFAVIDNNIQKKSDLYSDMIAELQDDYQNVYSASEEEKETLENAFLEKTGEIISQDKASILVEKALFYRGQLYLQQEEWVSAADDFKKIAEISPDSYLASVSLYNGASALENNGDVEEALSLLNVISEKYRSESPILPETLFNIARLNEKLGKAEDAITVYEDLEKSYPSSSWTNLAKTRIISLKASGVSQ
ncbi:tetratricopeptide repeat protein [Spirochaeta isovalerica]|uniref:TolA-binding protein n=1 Tax=Spirochaeta isovalerica TaxID=150 RepID=A0A841R4S2_9SPIO|nr:TolA-binding protein [Spirochaeta isovalerica]